MPFLKVLPETGNLLLALRTALCRAEEFVSPSVMSESDRAELYGEYAQEIQARGEMIANVYAFAAISNFLAGVATLGSDVKRVDDLLGAKADEVDGVSELSHFMAVCRALDLGGGAGASGDVRQGFFEGLALRLHNSSSLVGGCARRCAQGCCKSQPTGEDSSREGSEQ